MSATLASSLAERTVRWSSCLNVRDLGGLPLTGGGRTRFGAVVRADGLFRLTPTGLEEVHAYGIRTVIDLRYPDELARRPNPYSTLPDHGVTLVHASMMDMDNAAIVSLDRQHLPWVDWNVEMLRLARPQILTIMRTLAFASPGGSIYHCHAGKDRTGLLSILIESLVGVDDDAIADDYVASNENLKHVYAEILAQYPIGSAERLRLETDMPCRAETAHATLAHLRKRHGGVEDYLLQIGLEPQAIAALRARLALP
jgi:protein tyrosine/serine phosphatase